MADRRRNAKTAVVLFAVAGGMVGLAFAAVPLYQLFCQVTGYGGTPRLGAAAVATDAGERFVTMRFDSNVGTGLAWSFRPERLEMTVQAGVETLAFYQARNKSEVAETGSATFNVTPYKAAKYVSKVECFCFTEQTLEPGEEASMPVSFVVDPALFDDPNTRDVQTITLSYTFFRRTADTSAAAPAGPSARRGGDGG